MPVFLELSRNPIEFRPRDENRLSQHLVWGLRPKRFEVKNVVDGRVRIRALGTRTVDAHLARGSISTPALVNAKIHPITPSRHACTRDVIVSLVVLARSYVKCPAHLYEATHWKRGHDQVWGHGLGVAFKLFRKHPARRLEVQTHLRCPRVGVFRPERHQTDTVCDVFVRKGARLKMRTLFSARVGMSLLMHHLI